MPLVAWRPAQRLDREKLLVRNWRAGAGNEMSSLSDGRCRYPISACELAGGPSLTPTQVHDTGLRVSSASPALGFSGRKGRAAPGSLGLCIPEISVLVVTH